MTLDMINASCDPKSCRVMCSSNAAVASSVERPLGFTGAVVGVRHIADAQVRGVIQQQAEFLLLAIRAQPGHVAQIGAIHRHEIVESLTVGRSRLARSLTTEVDAPSARDVLHTAARRVAHVVTARARGIDLDLICQALLRDQALENALSRGRTADIA